MQIFLSVRSLLAVALCGCCLLAACNSADLAFVNEVKRFEPKWMNLSDKVAFVQRNLNSTQRRYEQDLKAVEPAFANTSSNSRTQIYTLRSEYRTVINQRDSIQANFDAERARFSDAVNRFNSWQGQVMKNQLGPDQAQADFEAFQKEYTEIDQAVGQLQGDVIANIEAHNSLMAQLAQKLKLYSNYKIDLK